MSVKRARAAPDDDPPTKRARRDAQRTLTRAEMLTLSSLEFDQYVSWFRDQHGATPAQETEFKATRRLIKNRESAQLSRKRKKSYIDDLEAKVATLEHENVTLRADVASLGVRNHQLRGEIGYLSDLIDKSTLGTMDDLAMQALAAASAHAQTQTAPAPSTHVYERDSDTHSTARDADDDAVIAILSQSPVTSSDSTSRK